MKKRGLSAVVSTVLLILIVISSVSIIWVVVNQLAREGMEDASACFGVFDQVRINNEYTCHNVSSNNTHFAIDIGDIDVEKVLVAITLENLDTDAFEITRNPTSVHNIEAYPEGSGAQISLPQKNGGRTYVATGFSDRPESIEITPVINGKVCDVSDIIYELFNCPQ